MSDVDHISVISAALPTFSIITPVYNAESTLPRTIASIVAQTEQDWELILCDDDSQDNSASIADAFSDVRIKVVKNRFEKGASGARKTARFFARGLYIAYLDADDEWLPNHLAVVRCFIRDYDAVFGNYISRQEKSGGTIYSLPSVVSKRSLRLTNFIPCLTVCHSAALLGYEDYPIIKKRNDFALWLAILAKNKVDFVNTGQVTAIYSNTAQGLSANKFDAIKYAYLNLRKHYNPLRSALYTLSHFIFAIIKKGTPNIYNAVVSRL